MPLLGTSVDAIDLAEDRGRFGALLDRARLPGAAVRDGALGRGGAGGARRRSASRCSCARPTSSAAGRWRSSTRSTGSRDYLDARDGARTAARSSSTASWRTRSRSTSTRCATARTSGSAGSCSTSRRPASTPATRPACCRRTRSAARCSTQIREQTRGIALGLGVVGLLNVQFAVHGGRAVRDRGQPARLAHGAVRLEGDRRAAGQDGLPADARRADRRPRPAGRPDGAATTCRSRRRCCRSTASRAPTRCSARRCARPAR